MDGWLSLIVFLLANVATASSGGIFTPDEWYRKLQKPVWCPPDWMFGAVWSVVFTMIAFAGWLVWEAGEGSSLVLPMGLYGFQLMLNFAWSAIFFGAKRPDWALAEVLVLWVAILGCIITFIPLSPVAAWLMVPYLAWASFAAALNANVWWRNRPFPRNFEVAS